ncbi:MAG: type III secretion system protein [Deltaproteobacteria bacterium]|jgi:hypothetical protein|nr:type III secretion system protein [Deltaproteobacteria bacterium]
MTVIRPAGANSPQVATDQTDDVGKTTPSGNANTLGTSETGTKKATITDSLLNELPQLLAPIMASGIALEVLVEAISSEERRTTIKSATESLKYKAEQQKAANDEALSQLLTQIQKLAQKEVVKPISKAFRIFGMIFGAIAAVATTALGVVTGNPLLIAAGVLMIALTVDNILSEATDGKTCLNALVIHIATKAGVSEDKARWIALAVTLALTLTTVALSLGSAFYAKGLELATKAASVIQKIQLATSLASSANSVASGAMSIVTAFIDYDIAKSKALTVQLEAILERIKQAIDVEEDFIKFLVENQSAVMTQVAKIVKEAADAQSQIMSGGSPAMA